MLFPFGKHQGEEIEVADTAYLKWMIAECKNISDELYEAIEEELEARYNQDKYERR
jgi:hypothetical protein